MLDWKDAELAHCIDLIDRQGDNSVGRDPKTIASYLRVQAADAFRDAIKHGKPRLFELAARLGDAATAINADARNDHAPNWSRAYQVLRDAETAPAID